jgi:hypothetical protein
MFKYFILRTQQQLFCYFCGIVLAMVLMLLFPSVLRGRVLSAFIVCCAVLGRSCPLYPSHRPDEKANQKRDRKMRKTTGKRIGKERNIRE